MSEQDNHIDELLEKAKNSPPALSLAEVKELLNKPKAHHKGALRRWMYFSLSGLLFIGLLCAYFNDDNNDRKSAGTRVVAQTPMKEALATRPEMKNENKIVRANEPAEKTAQVKSTISSRSVTMVVQDNALPKSSDSTKVSDSTSKATKLPARYVVEQREVIIPWFATMEMLKTYQDKLLESGIELKMTSIVFNSKDMKREFITELKAEIRIGDALIKSIHIKDFKELHISWETYNTGEVRIKSVKLLDKNYMSRKL